MVTVDHTAKEGKLKVFMIGVGGIVLAGVLLTLIHILCKGGIQKLEQAVS